MATYSNLGITLITTGDESGTWGTTTNSNFENILDEAIAGAVTHNISSDADFTLTVVDATSSDARHAVIKFTSTTLSATRTCTFAPDTLQKTWVVINATTGGQSLTFKQGSAGATVTVPNGESAIIYSDGAGATNGAITRVLDSFTNTKITTGTLNATTLDLTNLEVTNIKAKDGTAALTIADSTGKVTVSSELAVDNLNLSGNAITSTDSNGNIDLTPNGTGEVNITKVDIDSGAIDGTTIGANSAAAGTFTTLTATTLGGALNANSQAITNVNIDSGAIDGVTLGTNSPVTNAQIDNININGNAITSTDVNGNIDLTPNGTGEVNITKVDIDGGTIDNVTIGGSTSAAGTFTTLTATTGNITTVNATTVDATNVEVTNVKAKDGTAAIAIADSTGAVTVSTPTVVSVNSSSDALRITQVGAGNALLVQDAAGDASPFVINASGNTIVGFSSAIATRVATTSITPVMQVFDAGSGAYSAFRFAGASASPATQLFAKSRSGTVGTTGTVVVDGDGLMRISAAGDDGTQFTEAGRIEIQVDGTPGTNDMPGRLVFSTTADGASTPTERMRIDSSGNVGIGNTVASTINTVNGVGNLVVGSGSGSEGITIYTGTADTGGIAFADGTTTTNTYRGYINYAHATDHMAFWTSASERMRIDSSGNVGIGKTAATGVILDANGVSRSTQIQMTNSAGTYTSGSAGFHLFGFSDNNLYFNWFDAGAIVFRNNGTSERMRIDSSGNVGIGSSSPGTYSEKLIVASAGSAQASMMLQNPGIGSGQLGIAAASSNLKIYNTYTDGLLANGKGIDIDLNGNVGIGTASPYSGSGVKTLQVTGSDYSIFQQTTDTATADYKNWRQIVRGSVGSHVYQLQLMNDANSAEQTVYEVSRTANSVTYQRWFGGTSEAMRIDSSGNVGIGGTADANAKVQVKGTLPTSSNSSIGFIASGASPSGSTSAAYGFYSNYSTAAASFTLTDQLHFYANPVAKGAGSTIGNQYGFFASSGLTEATNNFGFYSNIASGSNRWNFYAAGTAQNYFAGDTGVGTTPLGSVRLGVLSAGTTSGTYAILARNSSSTDLFAVRSDGLFQTGVNTLSPYNNTTGAAADVVVDGATGALARSTSSLRYKKDIFNAAHGLAEVLKLRSVTYKGINDGDKIFGGLIAEEVHDAGLTEFVKYDSEGRPDALAYGNMVALLVKAVQELKAELDALKAV